jgi:hypothetical protein
MVGLPDSVFVIWTVNKAPKPSTFFTAFNDLRGATDDSTMFSDEGAMDTSCIVGMVSSGGGSVQDVPSLFD